MPFTTARSSASRSEFARVSVIHAPASTVQFNPRPDVLERLKESENSTVPGGGATPPPPPVPPSVPPSTPPSTPPSVPPSGGGGGGGEAVGAGALPKTTTALPELLASGVFPKMHGTSTVEVGSVSADAGYPLNPPLESSVVAELNEPACIVL